MKKRFLCFIPLLIAVIIAVFRIINWRINLPEKNLIIWFVVSTAICFIAPFMIFLSKKFTIKISLFISIILLFSQILINSLPSGMEYKLLIIKRSEIGYKLYVRTSNIPGCRFKSLIESYPYKTHEIYELEKSIKQNEEEYNKPTEYYEKPEYAQWRKDFAEKTINNLKEKLKEENEKNKNNARYSFFRVFDEGLCILLTIFCLILSIKFLRELPTKEKNNDMACKKCGCRIYASWNYCRNCGNILKTLTT